MPCSSLGDCASDCVLGAVQHATAIAVCSADLTQPKGSNNLPSNKFQLHCPSLLRVEYWTNKADWVRWTIYRALGDLTTAVLWEDTWLIKKGDWMSCWVIMYLHHCALDSQCLLPCFHSYDWYSSSLNISQVDGDHLNASSWPFLVRSDTYVKLWHDIGKGCSLMFIIERFPGPHGMQNEAYSTAKSPRIKVLL